MANTKMDELLNIISKYATMRLKADGPGKLQRSGIETLLNICAYLQRIWNQIRNPSKTLKDLQHWLKPLFFSLVKESCSRHWFKQFWS